MHIICDTILELFFFSKLIYPGVLQLWHSTPANQIYSYKNEKKVENEERKERDENNRMKKK